jgi:hypothetical protein
VTFSDPILVRYGAGVGGLDDEEDDMNSKENTSSRKFKMKRLPCPVLEFRVLNRLEGQKRGEIIDATMNIVASVDESQVAGTGKKGSKTMKRRGGKKGKGKRKTIPGVKKFHDDDEEIDRDAYGSSKLNFQNMLETSLRPEVEEDPNDDLFSKKVFAKLEIESQEHPFFNRIWVGRHILDENSPLLKQEVKELVGLNGGMWPEDLNNPQAIRASVDFDQILVSLSGTSNADCNSVYAQKEYAYVDLCVGYRFCNVLFRGADGGLSVDQDLLHDVTEQIGGGGENLQERAGSQGTDIFII